MRVFVRVVEVLLWFQRLRQKMVFSIEKLLRPTSVQSRLRGTLTNICSDYFSVLYHLHEAIPLMYFDRMNPLEFVLDLAKHLVASLFIGLAFYIQELHQTLGGTEHALLMR